MFLMKKITQKIVQRKNEKAEDEIVKYGYQQQNQYLVSQGFTKASQNLKAIIQANGDQNLALQILSQKSNRKEQKSQIKQERREMKSHIQEEKSKMKSANKMAKYQIKLQKLQPLILQHNIKDQLNTIQKMGYDNSVKVVKVLIKFSGDIKKSVEFIEKKSHWNKDKFKLAGLGVEDNRNAETSTQSYSQVGIQQQSVIDRGQWFSSANQQPQMQQNYPPQMVPSNYYPPQQPQQQQNQMNQQGLPQEQQRRERKLLKKNNDEFEIPQNIDIDAYQQMMVSKQEEIKNQASNFPVSSEEFLDFKDEDVEIYIKKNQYLISQGFKKADQNIEALLKCNGDEKNAIYMLRQNQQEKEFKKSNRGQQHHKDVKDYKHNRENKGYHHRGNQKNFQGKVEDDKSSSSSFSD